MKACVGKHGAVLILILLLLLVLLYIETLGVQTISYLIPK